MKKSTLPFIANLLLIVSMLVIFKPVLEWFLDVTVVQFLLSKVISNSATDAAALLVGLIVVVYTFVSLTRHFVSVRLFMISVVAVSLYSYYRLSGDHWIFRPFLNSPGFVYADVSYVLFCSMLAFCVSGLRDAVNEKKGGFFQDIPVGKSGTDLLGYQKYAATIADKINQSQFDVAFAIGINGPWGSGKTSMIDLIKRRLSEHPVVVIDYNRWSVQNSNSIIADFFETITDGLRPHSSSLAQLLRRYSDRLISIGEETPVSNFLNPLRRILTTPPIDSLFAEINSSIRHLNKTIVIVIDDLDRLNSEEIVEVIRLIRNTASFRSTFFLVGYDRGYVVHALRNKDIFKPEVYLEKIFQSELNLPIVKNIHYRQDLCDKLKELFPERDSRVFENEIISLPFDSRNIYIQWVQSIRDSTRLANAIALNMMKIIDDVYFPDFMKLELLRSKFPSVYFLLFNRTDEILESKEVGRKYHFVLKKSKSEPARFQIQDLVKDISGVTESQASNIIELLKLIFDDSLRNAFRREYGSNLSVIYPSKFRRYFAYDLPDENLSVVAFSKARSGDEEQFFKEIQLWVSLKLEDEVKGAFGEITDFDDREDFEKVVRVIFRFARLDSPLPELFYPKAQRSVGYPGDDLEAKLDNTDDRLERKFYGNGSELKSFVRGMFNDAIYPQNFEAQALKFLSDKLHDTSALSRSEMRAMVLTYFREYCETHDDFDSDFWELFRDCKIKDWTPENGSSYVAHESWPAEAYEIFRSFAERNIDNFLKMFVEQDHRDSKRFMVRLLATEIFGSMDLYKGFLEKVDDSKSLYIAEYRDFFSKCEKDGFQHYIHYEFQTIPVNL